MEDYLVAKGKAVLEPISSNKWIEIDVDAIRQNLREIRSRLAGDVKLIAVVKANAYGHGAEETARVLCQQGVDYFAVTFLKEALDLRKAGISANILVFAPLISENEIVQAILNNITVTVSSQSDWRLMENVIANMGKSVTVHLKIDTGLGRFGLGPDEVRDLYMEMNRNPQVYIEGIYTHMAQAGSAKSYTEKQFAAFLEVVRDLEQHGGRKIPLKHCANSAVFLKYPHMRLDAVRIGTLLSGQHPVGDFPEVLNLRDPYKYKCRILSVRTLPKGSFLGYFRTYRLRRTSQIAVLPVGFYDGLAVEVANKPAGLKDLIKLQLKLLLGYLNVGRFNLGVKIHGRSCPVRGKVFMQTALVEIPPGLEVNVGDEVELPIRKTLASGNINRVYLQEGQPGKISSRGSTNYVVENQRYPQ